MFKLFFLIAMLSSATFTGRCMASQAHKPSEEQVIRFYPTIGTAPTGELFMQGRVSEPENDSLKRKLFLRQLATWLGFDENEKNSPYLMERGLLFLEEEAENVAVTLSIRQKEILALKSGDEGYFDSFVKIPEFAGNEQFIKFTSNADDGRTFHGGAWMLADEGFSLISDIDDTVKITNVLDKSEMLKNTFARPFKAVPGMAALYQRLLAKGGSLHFVSAGPKQLTSPLQTFAEKSGFPPASFHMRFFHLDPSTISQISAGAEEFKLSVIRPLIQRFPKRKFLLVGDSGEKDPEVYSRVLAEFGSQIIGVWIRDVTNEPASSPRYKNLFPAGAPFKVFRDPNKLSLK